MSYHGVIEFSDGETWTTDSYDTRKEALDAAYEMVSEYHQGNSYLLMSDPFDDDVSDDEPDVYAEKD